MKKIEKQSFGAGFKTLKTSCKNGDTVACVEFGLKKLFKGGTTITGAQESMK